MNRVADGLRQTAKGQLCYNREIEGKALTDLLNKCASAPLLSSPHSEISPPRLGQSISFGLTPVEDDEQSGTVGFDLQELSKKSDGQDHEEKGHRDSFETELSPAVTQSNMYVSDSLRSPQISDGSPRSPGLEKAKSPLFCQQKAMSPAAQKIKRTEGSGASLNQSEDEGDGLMDPVQRELTVSFAKKLRIIHDVETGWDNRLKDLTEKKQLEFLEHQMRLGTLQEQLMSVVEQRQRHDLEQQRNIVEKTHLSRKQEIRQAVQRVKESHDQCSRRQDAKLKDLERLDQQLKEEKVRREQALEQRLDELRAIVRSILATRDTLMATLDNCPNKQHLPESAEKTRMLVRKVSEQVEAMVGSVKRSGPLDDILSKLKHFQEQCQNALDFVNGLTVEAEKKAKAAAEEAEKQRQQNQAAQQAQVNQSLQRQTADQSGQTADQSRQPSTSAQSVVPGEVRALAVVAKEYEDNIKLLSQTDAALQPFVTNQQMKKMRFDLQRAVNTPLNAISPVNSAHLQDKLLRLRSLLRGDTVEVQGKQVTAQSVPQGITFCKNLVAKMMARKADEQVSSSHESAFAIAAVAVGLWSEHPDVGELLMAHLQALCPYILPFYPPRLPNQSSADYHRALGYKVEEDGTIEQQDKFLRRMSGVVRFYAAILVTSPPQGANHPHPHGLEHAWTWLSRSLNLQPNPDITATAIYDMLQVTGHFLLKAYRVQFVKLLYFLFKVFLPKLKEVAAGTGPVSRLETFLETTMKNSAFIPVPEGYLPPQFF